MRVPSAAAMLAALFIGAVACYPNQIVDSISDLASVTTLVDSQAPLRVARTFAMPDTIIHSKRATGAGLIGHDNDAEVLAHIREGFIARGWRQVIDLRAERPDVVLLTVVFEQTNTGVAYGDWWSGWGYWPGWPAAYGPDWGWGYPGAAVTFSYESGTLAVVMLDVRNGNDSTRRIPLLWAAAVNGVLTASSVDGALAGIDQAFEQSPYLERP